MEGMDLYSVGSHNSVQKYDVMSDIFEYGNISDEEVVKLCNQILIKSKDEKSDVILEAMYHAVFTAVNCRDIGQQLEHA